MYLVIEMNFIEINKIFNKMVNNAKVIEMDYYVSLLKNGLIIDKKSQ
jgi:hypothetical protein